MNFTPKTEVRRFVGGFLTTAVMGITPLVVNAAPAPTNYAIEESVQAYSPAVGSTPAPGLQSAQSYFYQPVVSLQGAEHWVKKNAPTVGGAAGGALVGGLVGGGAGAVIGGAVGGGAGYAYQRHRHHEREERYRREYSNRANREQGHYPRTRQQAR
jgi:uncharacterized protein YcfJ